MVITLSVLVANLGCPQLAKNAIATSIQGFSRLEYGAELPMTLDVDMTHAGQQHSFHSAAKCSKADIVGPRYMDLTLAIQRSRRRQELRI